MQWNADHTTVGTKWGSAPSMCEGITAKIAVKTGAKKARVHAVDGKGARSAEVPAAVSGGELTFEIRPEFKTLWYEVVLEQ
jgi:hypothetical protein